VRGGWEEKGRELTAVLGWIWSWVWLGVAQHELLGVEDRDREAEEGGVDLRSESDERKGWTSKEEGRAGEGVGVETEGTEEASVV
jgi:hypothetical protein